MGKQGKSDAELEEMILQRLLIGGVFVSVRKDPILGWRPTVVTAPKHNRNAQELADRIAYIAESSKGVERPSAVSVVSFRSDYLSGSRFAFDDRQ